jgi:hypothetical protein
VAASFLPLTVTEQSVQVGQPWLAGCVSFLQRQKKKFFMAPLVDSAGTTKRCLADGDDQLAKGRHSQQRVTTGKIKGFRTCEKIRYQGQDCFIKGRMSAGIAILMDLAGNKMGLKPIPKVERMKRVSARTSWSMSQKPMPNGWWSLI